MKREHSRRISANPPRRLVCTLTEYVARPRVTG
jgi:hypothetical protein